MHTSDDALVALLDELVVLSDPATHPRAVALLERLGSGDLRVALVGEAKGGKSTLANALLGEEVLPAGVVPVTAISTEVRAGSPRRVEVTFTDGSAHTTEVCRVARYVSERQNSHNHQHVRDVRIHLPTGLPHARMVLLDTPGVGSVHRHNTDAAREAFTAMDAAVFVLTVDPPISASELALLQQVADLAVRVFVVLNKADQLAPHELAEASSFVGDVVTDTLGSHPELFMCSARDGLRARTAGDRAGWHASGVPAFLDALVSHLVDHREADLRASVAAAAARLAAQQLDTVSVTLAALEAIDAEQDQRLTELSRRLEAVDVHRDRAVDLVAGDLARARAQLDEDAAGLVTGLSTRARERLEEFVASACTLTAAQLEEQGRDLIAETTRVEVERWRVRWHEQLADVLDRVAEAGHHELTDAAGELHAAANEQLGVRLHSEIPVLAPPTLPNLRYEFDPGIGWNQAMVAGMRTHAPFGLARGRVARYLREQTPGLVDKHVGRARADFQDRLDEAGRRLSRELTDAFGELTAALTSGRDAARIMREHTEPGHRSETERLLRRHGAFAELTRQLEEVAKSRVPAPSAPAPQQHSPIQKERA